MTCRIGAVSHHSERGEMRLPAHKISALHISQKNGAIAPTAKAPRNLSIAAA